MEESLHKLFAMELSTIQIFLTELSCVYYHNWLLIPKLFIE